jgi:hypothetical protein
MGVDIIARDYDKKFLQGGSSLIQLCQMHIQLGRMWYFKEIWVFAMLSWKVMLWSGACMKI